MSTSFSQLHFQVSTATLRQDTKTSQKRKPFNCVTLSTTMGTKSPVVDADLVTSTSTNLENSVEGSIHEVVPGLWQVDGMVPLAGLDVHLHTHTLTLSW